MRLVKKRGCEKIRNYFFTCLFLCITKWFFLSVFLQRSANGHPAQSSHSYTSSCRKRQRSGILP